MNAQHTETGSTLKGFLKSKTDVSKTDWKRVESMTDDEIDTSDIPALDENFFANAEIRLPERKVPITLRLDREVLDFYKSFGKGYQTKINAILKLYMTANKK